MRVRSLGEAAMDKLMNRIATKMENPFRSDEVRTRYGRIWWKLFCAWLKKGNA